jgi:hypothetical protein
MLTALQKKYPFVRSNINWAVFLIRGIHVSRVKLWRSEDLQEEGNRCAIETPVNVRRRLMCKRLERYKLVVATREGSHNRERRFTSLLQRKLTNRACASWKCLGAKAVVIWNCGQTIQVWILHIANLELNNISLRRQNKCCCLESTNRLLVE